MDIGGSIAKWTSEDFTFNNGILRYKNDVVNKVIADRIIEMKEKGFPYEPMIQFLEKVYQNPSYRSVQGLYTFIQDAGLPITQKGNFLAYKYVHKLTNCEVECNNGFAKVGDFVDCYTKSTFRNNIGDVVTMPRNLFDDDFENICGSGLNVGSFAYCGYREYVVICEVNPKDVVSIPITTLPRNKKLICCEYKVVCLMERKKIKDPVISIVNDYSPEFKEFLGTEPLPSLTTISYSGHYSVPGWPTWPQTTNPTQ